MQQFVSSHALSFLLLLSLSFSLFVLLRDEWRKLIFIATYLCVSLQAVELLGRFFFLFVSFTRGVVTNSNFVLLLLPTRLGI